MFRRFSFSSLRRFLREQRGSWEEVRAGLRKRWFLSCGMIASATACAVLLQNLDSLDRTAEMSRQAGQAERPSTAERPPADAIADVRQPIPEADIPPARDAAEWEAVLAAQRRMWPEQHDENAPAGQADAHRTGWTLIRNDVDMDDNPFVAPAEFQSEAAEAGLPVAPPSNRTNTIQ
jgi:hypothetical protein